MRRRQNTSNPYLNSKVPQADHLYQEVTISTDDQKTIHDSSYNIQLRQDIINKANDYYVGISELRIPTRYLPVFVFKTQTNGLLSNYVMRLKIGGVDPNENYESVYILDWGEANETQADYDQNPIVDISRLQGTNKLYNQRVFTDVQGRKHYYVYDEREFISIVNYGLRQLVDAVDWPNGFAFTDFYITLIDDRLRINFSEDTYNFTDKPFFKLTFSDALYQIFNGFQAIKLTPEKSENINDPLTWLIQCNKSGSNKDILVNRLGFEGNYFFNEDKRVNFLEGWNPVKRIVVTSGELLVEPQGSLIANRSQFKNVLLSFIPVDMESKGYVNYKSEGSNDNLHDLLNNQAVDHLDLKFWWEDSLGNLHPIELPVDSNILLTLKFVKKQLINNFYRSDTL